jgi:hypothetical protein
MKINGQDPVLDYDGTQVVIDGAPQVVSFLIAGALSPAFAGDTPETQARREALGKKAMQPEIDLTDDDAAFILERAGRAEYEPLPYMRLREALGVS